MALFLVDLSLDGYDSDEEEHAACKQFINEQLSFSASSVKVHEVKEVAWISGKVIHQFPDMSHGYQPLYKKCQTSIDELRGNYIMANQIKSFTKPVLQQLRGKMDSKDTVNGAYVLTKYRAQCLRVQ